MKRRRFWIVTALVSASFCGGALGFEVGALRHEFLAHPENPEKRVEYFWTAPEGEGPFPAILYVHGHQVGLRPGARRYVNSLLLERTAESQVVAAALSMPGYGRSDGPSDFCGPFSQRAVRRILEALRSNPRVRPDRIVVYGYSRGAIVASMVAAQEPGLAGVILGAGIYDLPEAYDRLEEAPEGEESLKRNIRNEGGTTPQAFQDRSILLGDFRIMVPMLIVHGEQDAVAPVDQARRLERRAREWGTDVELAVFPGVAHGIPSEQLNPPVERFLLKVLGRKVAQ